MVSTDDEALPDIAKQIRVIRGQRVLLDSDLAALYGVPTHRFNEAVRRNQARFPTDFMFRLSQEEHGALISQIAISKDAVVVESLQLHLPNMGQLWPPQF